MISVENCDGRDARSNECKLIDGAVLNAREAKFVIFVWRNSSVYNDILTSIASVITRYYENWGKFNISNLKREK